MTQQHNLPKTPPNKDNTPLYMLEAEIDNDWADGVEFGLLEGYQDGLEEGRIQGTLEASTRIAMRMLSVGFDFYLTAELTGIPMSQLEDLCSQWND
jgi:predicted transposase YdaD